jgi:alkylation response protein AidB-like acyl-CoA dehydrogenase
MSVVTQPILSLQLLETLRSRAPGYDRDNRFFQEDFEDLRGAGDLQMAVPPEFGGLGLNLAESARETRRLAEYAPATVLGLNMHTYWVGVAADVWRSGDK